MTVVDVANRVAGEILRIAVNVERELDLFLMYYILGLSINKQNFLSDEILQRMNFQRKIELFEKIGKLEQFDKKKLGKIVSDIKFIQKRRNKVAHYDSSYEENQEHPELSIFRLWKPESTRYIKDTLVLNQETLDKIKNRFFSAIKGIVEVTNYIIEKDRKTDLSELLTPNKF